MVHGCDLYIEGTEGCIRKGLCVIHYDITMPKDTNPSYQREISGLTGRGLVAVIINSYFSYLNVHLVD